jgi:hypothetical protein
MRKRRKERIEEDKEKAKADMVTYNRSIRSLHMGFFLQFLDLSPGTALKISSIPFTYHCK